MFKNQSEVILYYQNLSKQQEIVIAQKTRLITRFSIQRIVLALLEVLLFVILLNVQVSFVWMLALLLAVPIVLFIFVVKKQVRTEKSLNFEKKLYWIYQNELQVLAGQANGYDNGTDFIDDKHPYTSDLDIFGEKSLYELINRCTSQLGKTELAHHLSKPMTRAQIEQRQQAIEEIQSHFDDTFTFRAILQDHREDKSKYLKQALQQTLAHQLQFVKGRFLQLYVKIQPYFLAFVFLIALIFGAKTWSVFGLMIFINVLFTSRYGKKINEVYNGFSGTANVLNQYADAINWIENKKWQSSYIKTLINEKFRAGEELKSLSAIIAAFDARLNMLLYALLNYFLLWDLKCCIRLANWNKKSSHIIAQSLDNIAYFEELISLTTLKHNHPNWTFPAIKSNFSFVATQIGHPLIPENQLVNNDYKFMSEPSVDIITGSNMAGKSTFLRTIGINLVLAYAGAPVCAQNMQLSIFQLLTYMRIRDNLMESTSTFKAELNRLKMILENITTCSNPLVLIDEMLRGTNSKDKFEGSKAFIEKVKDRSIPMLFATHDLLLSELENKFPQHIRNYHFDIQMEEEDMHFDYCIKQGPCAKFNASILLKQLGL